jgi:hypothetical protein
MPSETHVTGTGQRITVTCGDRTYQLRPITFGEAAELAQAEAGEMNANAAVLREAERAALRTLGGEDMQAHLDAMDAHEAAEIDLIAIRGAEPHPQEPPEALAAWRAERQRAHAELLRRAVAKSRVERLVAKDEKVRAIHAGLEAGAWQRRLTLLMVCLDKTEDEVRALPAGDAETLFQRADALRRPGVPEGKA